MTRQHGEMAEARQLGDQVLGDAVAEVGPLRVAAEFVEGKDGQHRHVGGRRRNGRLRRAGGEESIGAHRAIDVLEPMLAHELEGEIELAVQIVPDGA